MFRYSHYYFFALLFLATVKQNCSICRNYERTDEKLTVADDHSLLMNALQLDDLTVFHRVLNNILIPRVVGTANHTHVINYLTNELKTLGWTVEKDMFTSYTPLGRKSFANIVATPNPRASRYLDIACHFDSKLYENFVFVGATDSAVPCAIMVQLASSLDRFLNSNNELSLRLIFFDGEEAFIAWTDTDSLYGSRHLAEKWANTPYKNGTALDRINLMVLLDLLGSPNPTFYSFFSKTLPFYRMLVSAESKLNRCGLLNMYPRNYFRKMSTDSSIQDDHLPFLYRGVPILHIIPVPFPEVWHTADDDYDAIDFQTVANLTKIFGVFILEYLGIV